MGGRDKNFDVSMPPGENIQKTKFSEGIFFVTPFKSVFQVVVMLNRNMFLNVYKGFLVHSCYIVFGSCSSSSGTHFSNSKPMLFNML